MLVNAAPGQPYTLRQAMPADVTAISTLDTLVFAPYGTAEDQAIIAARVATFPAGVLVAHCDDDLIGYASAEQWATERAPALNEDPTQTHYPTGAILCITAMAVHPDWQNQGIGSALLAALILLARRRACTRVILETTHAARFYRERGFASLREQHAGGVRLIVMARDLA